MSGSSVAVFVDESAEHVDPFDAPDVVDAGGWGDPCAGGSAVIPARWTRRWPSSITNSACSLVRPIVSTVRESQARVPAAWARRNWVQVGPLRRGAGPRWWRRRIVRADV